MARKRTATSEHTFRTTRRCAAQNWYPLFLPLTLSHGLQFLPQCRASLLEMHLNKWDQDLDSTMSSSSVSSDSDGDDAGCESYIMGVIARKGAFWMCRCGGFKAAGRSLAAVGANPANIYPAIDGMAPTWNETQFRRVHVQVSHYATSHLPMSPVSSASTVLSLSLSSHLLFARRHSLIWVSVQVLAARNLLARDKAFFGGGGSSDPYVKLKYKKINTIKSEWIEKTCNPSWCALLLVHT